MRASACSSAGVGGSGGAARAYACSCASSSRVASGHCSGGMDSSSERAHQRSSACETACNESSGHTLTSTGGAPRPSAAASAIHESIVSASSSRSLSVGGAPAMLCRRHSSAMKSPGLIMPTNACPSSSHSGAVCTPCSYSAWNACRTGIVVSSTTTCRTPAAAWVRLEREQPQWVQGEGAVSAGAAAVPEPCALPAVQLARPREGARAPWTTPG